MTSFTNTVQKIVVEFTSFQTFYVNKYSEIPKLKMHFQQTKNIKKYYFTKYKLQKSIKFLNFFS